jgi:hypothetical protein
MRGVMARFSARQHARCAHGRAPNAQLFDFICYNYNSNESSTDAGNMLIFFKIFVQCDQPGSRSSQAIPAR